MNVMNVIEVDGLTKAYDGRRVLDGVSLSVAAGEVVAVLGPNGAGKTTLLEILEGHRRRDGGTARVLGDDPDRPSSSWRSRIGIVLQEQGALSELKVREALELYGGYYPSPRPPADVLELVGLADRAEDRVDRLSGGAQRRLDLALGLVGRPELLFLDEPTTGFDPDARRQAWTTIAGLRSAGTTIVLTTHYLDEAAALADRVVVLRAGTIVAEGSPAELAGRGGPPVVRFSLPPGVRPPSLVPRSQVTDGGCGPGGSFTVTAPDPVRTLAALCRWAERTGRDIPDLTVTRPSLEDVYLELIA